MFYIQSHLHLFFCGLSSPKLCKAVLAFAPFLQMRNSVERGHDLLKINDVNLELNTLFLKGGG